MASVKIIRNSGQISLGKEYAGRTALVDELEPGVWIIKVGEFVPDSERWLLASGVAEKIDAAHERVSRTPPQETDLEDLAKKIG